MNKQLKLAKRPFGLPDANTWRIDESPIPKIQDGEVLIKQEYVSLDPAMRGWMNDAKSYMPPIKLGAVMRAGSIGTVIDSKNVEFKVGDVLTGVGGVQQYIAVNPTKSGFYKVDTSLAPMPVYIGTLGMPGMTAYFGILEVGKIKEGETVFVSGAAGAVGSIVGQIAKIKGCKVVGTAGGPEKCKYVVEHLGFDACIDYKNESVSDELRKAVPQGIDVYFDNVGGEILDIALTQIRMKARIVICGAISQYNNTTAIKGPSNYLTLLVYRAKMEGMLVTDYAKDYRSAAMQMGMWMAQGKLKSREDIYEGIENFRETFLRLFNGQKLGKLVLKISEN